MNLLRVFPRPVLLGAAALMGLMVVGCVPVRLEASWPALSVVPETGDVLLTYHDRVVMIEPETGELARLRNVDGEVRLDENGNPRVWEFTGDDGQAHQFYSAPVQLDDETLLIAGYDNRRIYEVDLPTARVVDSADPQLPGQVIADLVQDDDALYVGISERNLVSLDSASLQQNWLFETEHGVWTEPLIVDNVLYLTALDHFLYAINAQTGEEIWRLDLQGAAPGTPVLYEDHLYIGSFARKLYDISLDGEILAEYDTAEWVWGAPVIYDDVLYAADLGGNVYALDISDGGFSEQWRVKVAGRGIRPSPVVTEDYVIVGSRDQKVYWLGRANGRVIEDEGTVESVQNLRVRELAGEIYSDMLLLEPGDGIDIPEPYLLVSSVANPELLVAFRVSNGERLWSYGR